MRISDWSSDVCSSDLGPLGHGEARVLQVVVRVRLGVGRDREEVRVDAAELHLQREALERVAGALVHAQRAVRLAGDDFRALLDFRGERHGDEAVRSEEHTSELQSLMRISYAVFCLKTKKP